MTLKNLLGISLDAVARDEASVSPFLAFEEREPIDARFQGPTTDNSVRRYLPMCSCGWHRRPIAGVGELTLSSLRRSRDRGAWSGGHPEGVRMDVPVAMLPAKRVDSKANRRPSESVVGLYGGDTVQTCGVRWPNTGPKQVAIGAIGD